MNCQSCGNPIKSGSKFCVGCGQSISTETKADASPSRGTSGPFTYPSGGSDFPKTDSQLAAESSEEPKPPDLIAQAADQARLVPDQDRVAAGIARLDPVRWAHSIGSQLVQQIPDLAAEEEIKRHWVVTRRRRPLGRVISTITLTDSRLIYVADELNIVSSSRNAIELKLSEISGIQIYTESGLGDWRLPLLVFLLLPVVVTSILSTFSTKILANSFWLYLVFFGALIWGIFERRIGIEVISSQSSGAGRILIGKPDGGIFHRTITAFLRILTFPFTMFLFPLLGIEDVSRAQGSRPTAQARVMANEIGAAILDLQNRGTLAE